MKKLFWFLSAVVFIGVGLFWGSERNIITDDKPLIKIGATLPLSGDSALAGKASKAALEMVLADLLKQGLKYDYQLVFEDNQGNPLKTAITSQKLINIDKVSAVFSLWNVMGSVVANIANPKKIINMTCSWEEESLIGPYTFNAISTNEQIAGLLVDELKTNGIKTVAILIDNSGETIMKLAEEKMRDAGIEVVFSEISNMGSNDYKMAIIKASAQKPDIYVVVGVPPMPFVFVKQLAEITGQKNVTGIDGFMEMSDDQRSLVEGLWYVDSNVNGTAAFARDLSERKGTETQSCAGNLAASLQILVDGFESAEAAADKKVPDADAVEVYLRQKASGWETVSGKAKLIRNGVINVEPIVRVIQDGQAVDRAESIKAGITTLSQSIALGESC